MPTEQRNMCEKLDEINKASERFRGMSDAADISADRASKTPHVDAHTIAQVTNSVNGGKA